MFLILGLAGLSVLIIAGAAEAQANPNAGIAITGSSSVSTADILAPTTVPVSAPLSSPSPESQKALAYISQQHRTIGFSAPQVAGEAALLIHRNPQLRNWPEALRAIIMATATNNVDGPTGIPTGQELKDGAGGINADLADIVASTHGSTPSTSSNPCSGPCWWAECIAKSSGNSSCPNGGFDGSGFRWYYFNGQQGDRVRIAISWWSDPECVIGTFGCDGFFCILPDCAA